MATSSPSIQAIDRQSVHRICSGQVILDLGTAVKELVENSLDANATNIEIRLMEYGKDFIEVVDNGSGIEEKDFESIALKHYTSKLKEFNDLTLLHTFGFRGEALSSLSAVSDLFVSTQHKNANFGTKLEFDHNGKILKKMRIAKETGTTVTISNLFYVLPVRYKEFHRNIKKEFTKLVSVLHAITLINSHVRFKCVNTVSKKRNLVISTNGKKCPLDAILSIFGSKQAKSLLEIKQADKLDESVLEEFNLQTGECKKQNITFKVNGFVSNVCHGYGRSSPDRQFFFINNRPCDFPKLSRLVNEVYHQYNRHQYPFLMLDIYLERDYIDVNVTPDKRKILIHQEKLLFALIKSTLNSMFKIKAGCYNENIISTPNKPCSNSLLNNWNDKISDKVNAIDSTQILGDNPNHTGTSQLQRFQSKMCVENHEQGMKEEQNIRKVFKVASPQKRKFGNIDTLIHESKTKNGLSKVRDGVLDISNSDFNASKNEQNNDIGINIHESKNHKKALKCSGDVSKKVKVNLTKNIPSRCDNQAYIQKHCDDICDDDHVRVTNGDEALIDHQQKRKTIQTSFNLDLIMKSSRKCNLNSDLNAAPSGSLFYAKISPNDNERAEAELLRFVSKEMFQRMKIVGQFNLGFIVGKLENDIFIVDQHAADEKYNFEILQLQHSLQGQRLIHPIPLELTYTNENILKDNIDIFKKNGFDFEILEPSKENVETSSIRLLAVPSSRNWMFSVDDVHELVFLLSDSPGRMCRPSRVRAMFASRACRMSYMVGTALDKATMKKIISHLAEIDHPWNCPHGRPVMRHLLNLKRVINQ